MNGFIRFFLLTGPLLLLTAGLAAGCATSGTGQPDPSPHAPQAVQQASHGPVPCEEELGRLRKQLDAARFALDTARRVQEEAMVARGAADDQMKELADRIASLEQQLKNSETQREQAVAAQRAAEEQVRALSKQVAPVEQPLQPSQTQEPAKPVQSEAPVQPGAAPLSTASTACRDMSQETALPKEPSAAEPPVARQSLQEIVAAVVPRRTDGEAAPLVILLQTDALFSPEQDLTPAGRQVLAPIKLVLASMPQATVEVRSHTDGRPVVGRKPGRPRSNWELAALRGGKVAAYLLEPPGLAPDRLRIVSFADTKPLKAERTEADRRNNRRIELHVLPGP
ncbi:MAG: OmpA family protein [Nitrospirota bacterium]